MTGRKLRLITGWSLLVGAFGVGVDAWLSWDDHQGSWGLIPAYMGTVVGLVGLVLVVARVAARWPAILAGLGVASTLVFWGSYPSNAPFGGVGSVLIGISVLWLPGWGRLASPLWVAAATFGAPQPGVRWGPISGFTLMGVALAVTGAFLLFGLNQADESERSRRSQIDRKRGTSRDAAEDHA